MWISGELEKAGVVPHLAHPDCRGETRRFDFATSGRMQSMLGTTTVEEIVPLVEALSPRERARLLHLITRARNVDSSVYEAIPPSPEEFSGDEDPLAWDSEGWENVA